MRWLKLLLFGVIGALGILRGAELVVTGSVSRAVVPLALGILFAALFAKAWRTSGANN